MTQHQGEVPEPGGVPLGDNGCAAFGPVLVVRPTLPDTSNHIYSIAYAIEELNDWTPPVDGNPPFSPCGRRIRSLSRNA